MPNFLVTLDDGRKLKIDAETPEAAGLGAQSFLKDNPLSVSEDVKKAVPSGIMEGAPFAANPVAGAMLAGVHGLSAGLNALGLPEEWTGAKQLHDQASQMYQLRKTAGDPRAYEPKTSLGKLAKAGMTGMTAGVTGGPGAAALGGVSGLTSEGAGQVAEGTPYETAARIAGGVVPGTALGALRAASTPKSLPLTRDAVEANASRATLETQPVYDKALSTHDTFSEAKTAAEARGGSAAKYNSQITRLIADNDFLKTLSPELQDQLRATQKGTLGQRSVRVADHLLTGTFSPGRAALAALGLHGDILPALMGDVARMGLRKVFQGIDDRIARKSMDELLQMSLKEAPPGAPQAANIPQGLLPPPSIKAPGPPTTMGDNFSMTPGATETAGMPIRPGPQPLMLPPPQKLLPPPTITGGPPWHPETPPVINLGKDPQAVSYWEHNGRGVPQIRDASGKITPASVTIDNIRPPALRDAMGRFMKKGAIRGKTSRPPQEEPKEWRL